MKNLIVAMALGIFPATAVYAQSYFEDDIYYNPKKDTAAKPVKKTEKKKSNYIANYSDIDVDTYNRRGQYYNSPVDTIGSKAGQDADFVYTQQIQKYYNPTIVVDNANVLADVLENSYGNVDIEISAAGYPVFLPGYGYSYGWPYYSRRGFYSDPWGWSISFYDPWYSWNWGPSWGWGPSWTWNWGPSWTWGPSWSWGWGPSWGPVWGPSWGHHHGPVANWNPNGNRPVAPNHGWSQNGRPSFGIANNHRQPVGTSSQGVRPGSTSTSRPAHASGVTNNNGRWEYVNGGHRVPAGSVATTPATNTNRPSVTNGTVNNHRSYGNGNNGIVTNNRTQSTTTNRNSNTTNRNSNTNNTRNYNNSNSNNSRSYGTGNSNSYNRSSGGFGGGSFGGSRSTGGGAGRSTGGGGHRR